jgi:prevent-host-death family protein
MTRVGVRELKNNLSKYVRDAERGKPVAVTAHGRVVAELVPAGTARKGPRAGREKIEKILSRYEELVAEGVIRPALEDGDPFEGLDPTPLLKPGEGLAILDWLREDK